MEKTMTSPDKLTVGRVYSGAQVTAHFAAKTPSLPLLRFTNEHECHRNFSYKTGLNVDILPFTPRGECAAGGLYFTATEHAHHHVNGHTYVRTVTLPDDARVYIEVCKI